MRNRAVTARKLQPLLIRRAKFREGSNSAQAADAPPLNLTIAVPEASVVSRKPQFFKFPPPAGSGPIADSSLPDEER